MKKSAFDCGSRIHGILVHRLIRLKPDFSTLWPVTGRGVLYYVFESMIGETGEDVKRRTSMKNKSRLILGLWSLASVIVFLHTLLDFISDSQRYEWHAGIIARDIGSPYRYRILVPYLIEASGLSLVQAYYVLEILLIFALVVAIYRLYSQFMSSERAFIRTAYLCAIWPVMLYDFGSHSWSFLEALLFILALLCVHSRRHIAIAFLVVLATLNRETGLIIVLAYFAIAGLDRWAFLYAMLWIATYGGLRLMLGHAEHVTSLRRILLYFNLYKYLPLALLKWGLLLPFPLFNVITRWSKTDIFFRRSLLGLLPYVGLYLVFGNWAETRQLLPVMIIMMGFI